MDKLLLTCNPFKPNLCWFNARKPLNNSVNVSAVTESFLFIVDSLFMYYIFATEALMAADISERELN